MVTMEPGRRKGSQRVRCMNSVHLTSIFRAPWPEGELQKAQRGATGGLCNFQTELRNPIRANSHENSDMELLCLDFGFLDRIRILPFAKIRTRIRAFLKPKHINFSWMVHNSARKEQSILFDLLKAFDQIQRSQKDFFFSALTFKRRYMDQTKIPGSIQIMNCTSGLDFFLFGIPD